MKVKEYENKSISFCKHYLIIVNQKATLRDSLQEFEKIAHFKNYPSLNLFNSNLLLTNKAKDMKIVHAIKKMCTLLPLDSNACGIVKFISYELNS